MRAHRLSSTVIAPALVLFGCSERPTAVALAPSEAQVRRTASSEAPDRYVVLFRAEQVPPNFQSRVHRLGGELDAALDQIGVGIVSGLSAEGAASLAGDADILAVGPDSRSSLREDDRDEAAVPESGTAVGVAAGVGSPADAPYYRRQWNMRAIHADEAWAAGHRGSRKVRVAIMDTGIDYTHPDLAGLVDVAASRWFVSADSAALESNGRLPFGDRFWHGTAVASVVATNAKMVAGVNREVTLIAIKVADSTGNGPRSAGLRGVMYAADLGVDLVNISGGGRYDKSDNPGMIGAEKRAFNYAYRHGVLVVGVTGNEGHDWDHDGDLVATCAISNGLCAAATGPSSADSLEGPWVDVDGFASYSGFGRSIVSVAAPGGTRNKFTRIWVPCTSTPSLTSPTPCRNTKVPLLNRLQEGVGTSFSAPHTVGLAALLKAQNPSWGPARLRAAIQQSADDLGEPGVDPYYGHGRINVARALGLRP